MKNDLFEKAKQAVAEKHGFSQWRSVPIGAADVLTEKAIALYGEYMANEAVTSAKGKLKDYILSNPPSFLLENILNAIPLPFPQQPDGI